MLGKAIGGNKDFVGKFAVRALLRNMFSPVPEPWVLSLKGIVHERPNIREVAFSKRGKKNFNVPWCHALWALRARFHDRVSANSSRSVIIYNSKLD